MEIILGLAFVALVAYYFYNKKKNEVKNEVKSEVPYKVEVNAAPAVEVLATVNAEVVESTTPAKKEKPAKKTKVKKAADETPKKVVKSKADVRASGIKRVK